MANKKLFHNKRVVKSSDDPTKKKITAPNSKEGQSLLSRYRGYAKPDHVPSTEPSAELAGNIQIEHTELAREGLEKARRICRRMGLSDSSVDDVARRLIELIMECVDGALKDKESQRRRRKRGQDPNQLSLLDDVGGKNDS